MHASNRFGEPLHKNTFEHDHELVEIHISLLGVAIVHERTEQHIDQHGIGKKGFQHLSR